MDIDFKVSFKVHAASEPNVKTEGPQQSSSHCGDIHDLSSSSGLSRRGHSRKSDGSNIACVGTGKNFSRESPCAGAGP